MSAKVSPEEFYDKFASTYDVTTKDPTANVVYVKEAAKIFYKHNSCLYGTILDLGCGTGLISELLPKKLEYTGIDVSEKMLHYAFQRGYKTIHKPIEKALPEIPDHSYDFVFALSCLLFVEDINSVLMHINRIARKAILLSLDNATEEYLRSAPSMAYNHSQVPIYNAKEDYFIRAWTSPSTGITIQTRMIYLEKVNAA